PRRAMLSMPCHRTSRHPGRDLAPARRSTSTRQRSPANDRRYAAWPKPPSVPDTTRGRLRGAVGARIANASGVRSLIVHGHLDDGHVVPERFQRHCALHWAPPGGQPAGVQREETYFSRRIWAIGKPASFKAAKVWSTIS